jgi:2-methylcitrate dehydratase PrpD
MSVAESLSKNIASIGFTDLPPETVDVTKRSILDTVGVILGASTLGEGCREMVELAKEGGGKEESSIMALGGKVPCWMAAFANGSMSHPLDYDDTHDEAAVHPTAATLPAALAVAERIGKVDGKRFISAIALGNDLIIRLALGVTVDMNEHGWLPPQLFGNFGAAAAAAKILGLNEDQISDALGITLSQAAGSLEVAMGTGSVVRAVRDAFTGKTGVISALMSEKGLTGVRTWLEGKAGLYNLYFRGRYDLHMVTAELGHRFEGTYVSFKPWPACRITHPYLTALFQLVKEKDIKLGEIESVVLVVGSMGRMLCLPEEVRRSPQKVIDAKFSLPFTIRVALTHGKVALAHYTPEAIKNSDVLTSAQNVSWRLDEGRESASIEPGVIELKTKSGDLFSQRADFAYGHPKNPMTTDDLIAKFRDCCNYSAKPLSPDTVDRVIHLVTHLEDVEDVAEITQLLS